MKKREFTFEDFVACRKQLENEGMDFTQEKGLIVFSSEEYGVFRYQHVDDWFPELKQKHPDIAFMYLDTFGLPDRVLSESVHVILQRGDRLYNVSAKMKSRDGMNPPRFEYVEIDEEYGSSVLVEKPSATMFSLLTKDFATALETHYTWGKEVNEDETTPFANWKKRFKNGVHFESCELIEENEESLILKYKQTSQDYHFRLHHELTRCLNEKGIPNVDVVHGCSFLNKERHDEKYEIYFYHQAQLMVAEINIQVNGRWQLLDVSIQYVNQDGGSHINYEEEDLNVLKREAIEAVKNLPEHRLFAVTGVLKEKQELIENQRELSN